MSDFQPPFSRRKRKPGLFQSPQALLIGGFAAIILVGAVVLWLPFCHHPGEVNFLEALFTSTSAVCVTGLTVVDTGTTYTLAGQVVVMLLIQAGGLGIMTFAALTFQLLGSKMSLTSRAALHDSFFQEDVGGKFKTLFRRILGVTLVIELAGAAVMSLVLVPRYGLFNGLFSSLFHAVSAFCNAGFSLYRTSLVALRGNALVVVPVMSLIVLGGLGYAVLLEVLQNGRTWLSKRVHPTFRLVSLHTRVVLVMTASLIVFGALGLMVLGLTPGEHTTGSEIAAALFQSITARTAGFNTVQVGNLPDASLILLVVLMFIGGSPGSCAGGIKTTSFAVWLARFRSRVMGEEDVHIMGRRIPKDILRRTTVLISLSLLWNGLGIMLLMALEGHVPGVRLRDVVFEQISAFGTVGLSTGLTPSLTSLGRIWIIATMFVGRLGPLTMAMWMFRRKKVQVRYPAGRVMIG